MQRSVRDNAALLAALLAALIALGGVIYTQIVTTANTQEGLAAQRELEEERAREAELQTYFDDMGQMLLDEDNPLSEADSSDPISTLARAKTLAIFERSDGLRKRIILQFLFESRLLRKEAIVSLADANLSEADLRDADLIDASVRDANLNGATVTEEQLGAAKTLKGATRPDGSKHD